MKRVRKILLASVIFCTISGQVTYASATTEENTPIIIDGIYSDWDGIPNCIDKESDSDKKSEDLKRNKVLCQQGLSVFVYRKISFT